MNDMKCQAAGVRCQVAKGNAPMRILAQRRERAEAQSQPGSLHQASKGNKGPTWPWLPPSLTSLPSVRIWPLANQQVAHSSALRRSVEIGGFAPRHSSSVTRHLLANPGKSCKIVQNRVCDRTLKRGHPERPGSSALMWHRPGYSRRTSGFIRGCPAYFQAVVHLRPG